MRLRTALLALAPAAALILAFAATAEAAAHHRAAHHAHPAGQVCVSPGDVGNGIGYTNLHSNGDYYLSAGPQDDMVTSPGDSGYSWLVNCDTAECVTENVNTGGVDDAICGAYRLSQDVTHYADGNIKFRYTGTCLDGGANGSRLGFETCRNAASFDWVSANS